MLIGLSGTGPRTSILHVWHTSFVNFFANNHILWSHDEIIFHLNSSAVPKKSDICVHSTFSANWTKCRKIWRKTISFFKKETFSPPSLLSMLQLPSSSTPATLALSLSHHENKMKFRQDSPVFTILIISTKAAGRTWAFTRTPAEIRASNSSVSNSAILCSVRGVQTNLLYTPFFSATFSISCEISKASIFV